MQLCRTPIDGTFLVAPASLDSPRRGDGRIIPLTPQGPSCIDAYVTVNSGLGTPSSRSIGSKVSLVAIGWRFPGGARPLIIGLEADDVMTCSLLPLVVGSEAAPPGVLG
jgi:hypothetical protein